MKTRTPTPAPSSTGEKKKKITDKQIAYFLYDQMRKRCLLEGCRYGIEHVDKKPLDACIWCNEPNSGAHDFWGDDSEALERQKLQQRIDNTRRNAYIDSKHAPTNSAIDNSSEAIDKEWEGKQIIYEPPLKEQSLEELEGKLHALYYDLSHKLISIDDAVKMREFIDFIKQREAQLISKARTEVLEEVKERLPKELGFDDYDKHVHTYIHENRGNCGICGLSWKKAGQYEIYNNAIIQVRRLLKDLDRGGKG